MAAIQRMQSRETAVRMQATRLAVWGEAEDVRAFLDRLSGRPEAGAEMVDSDRDAALRAFGLRAG